MDIIETMKKFKFDIKKIKLYLLIDFLFFNFSFFLILFAWVRFLTRNVLSSVIISIIILIVANFVKNALMSKKENVRNETKSKQNELETGMLTLLSSTNQSNLEFFLKVFSKFKDAKIENEFIVFEDKIVYVDFTKKIINLESAIKKIPIAMSLKKKELLLLCYGFDTKDRIFVENLKGINVKIVEKNEIFNLLFIPSNIFPEKIFETKSNAKLKFKQILKMSFKKDKAKKYFLSGILVFFCSLIVKNNIFYVLMSSIMFCFALISLTKKEEVTNFFD